MGESRPLWALMPGARVILVAGGSGSTRREATHFAHEGDAAWTPAPEFRLRAGESPRNHP